MTENHEGGRDHDHNHGPDQSPDQGAPLSEQLDSAGRSLAEALRLSFRVLGAIMAVLIVAYLASGVTVVRPGTRAVVLRFGELVRGPDGLPRVLDARLHLLWPYPIDEVITVPTGTQTALVESFWHYVSPSDVAKESHEIRPASQGLRVGFDGALMTGDRGFMHVKFKCVYRVPEDDPQAVLDYVGEVADVSTLLSRAIDNAAIRVAARSDLDRIIRRDEAVAAEIRRLAQEVLAEMRCGLRIQELQALEVTPPIQTIDAFNLVTSAEVLRSQAISEATKSATGITSAAAGPNCRTIAEAIRLYDVAIREADQELMAARYEEIGELLMDPHTTGQARNLITQAQADAAVLVGEARTLADEFQKLLGAYREAPELTVAKEWYKTKQEILANELAVKQLIPLGTRYVLYATLHPDVLARQRRIRVERTGRQLEGTPPEPR